MSSKQAPEPIGVAIDRVLAAWNAFLDDQAAFDALGGGFAMARLAAACTGRPYMLSAKRVALEGTKTVSIVDLPREDREFSGPAEDQELPER